MDKIISCGIYLFRSDNKFLIAHPTNFKETIWGVPKGRIDEGEIDMFEVAKRELFEESNIDLNNYDIKKFKEFDITHFKGNKYFKGFLVSIDSDFSDVDIRCDSMVVRGGLPVFPEMDDFKWVTIEEGKEILSQYQSVNLDDCSEIVNSLKYIKKFESYSEDNDLSSIFNLQKYKKELDSIVEEYDFYKVDDIYECIRDLDCVGLNTSSKKIIQPISISGGGITQFELNGVKSKIKFYNIESKIEHTTTIAINNLIKVDGWGNGLGTGFINHISNALMRDINGFNNGWTFCYRVLLEDLKPNWVYDSTIVEAIDDIRYQLNNVLNLELLFVSENSPRFGLNPIYYFIIINKKYINKI